MKLTTQKGYWFSNSFKEYFGEPEMAPAKVPEFFTLEKDMNDFEILEEINNEYCTLEQVAGFLENPPEGTKDGKVNIFYVKQDGQMLYVYVHWSRDVREWICSASRPDEFQWNAGYRVFRNSTSDALSHALNVVKEAGYVVVKGEVV